MGVCVGWGSMAVVEMGAEMGVAEGGDCLGIARFGFNDLCAKPLGSTDYAALAEVRSLTVVNEWFEYHKCQFSENSH